MNGYKKGSIAEAVLQRRRFRTFRIKEPKGARTTTAAGRSLIFGSDSTTPQIKQPPSLKPGIEIIDLYCLLWWLLKVN